MIKYLRNLDSEDPVDSPLPVVILDEEIDALPFDRIACPDLKAIAEVWLDLPRADGDMLPRWSSFSPAMDLTGKRQISESFIRMLPAVISHSGSCRQQESI